MLRLNVASGLSPWVAWRDLSLQANIDQPFTNTLPAAIDWEVQAAEFRAAGLAARRIRCQGRTTRDTAEPERCATDMTVAVGEGERSDIRGEGLQIRAQVVHALNQPLPQSVDGTLELAKLQAGKVELHQLQSELHLRRTPPPSGVEDLPFALWRVLGPWQGEWEIEAGSVRSPPVDLDHLGVAGQWAFPRLTLDRAQLALCDGALAVKAANLDVVSREADAALTIDFDIQRLDRALPAEARRWLAQFGYRQPPHTEAKARVRLPAWHEWPADPGPQLLESLEMQARIEGTQATFNGLSADRAGVTVSISNQTLRLRDLFVLRPEGRADLSYDLDLRKRDFRWMVSCGLDPHAAVPAIEPAMVEIVRPFHFESPPRVTGEVWGNWAPPKIVNLALDIAATNLAFRGERFDRLQGHLTKTNDVFTAAQVTARRNGEVLEAPWVRYDAVQRRVELARARTTMDPLVLARCIGTNVEALLVPYRFAIPPEVEVNGYVRPGQEAQESDLTFAVSGGPFQYWRFNTQRISSVVRWRGQHITVTNLACEFYGGRLSGEFLLDLLADRDARFRFQARGTDFSLAPLLQDTVGITNRVSGTVTGTLVVTNALLSDWQSWQGYGQARMRDGMLWDLPIFGALSRVMNFLVPGVGNSRATAASGHYTLTRSVIRTDDLEIAAGPALLQYRGTVDFAGKVDARIMAEVLHKTPLIGPLISLALSPAAKALEFKVGGTLGNPELKPLHVPGFLLPFLNPIGTVQGIVAPKAKP
jgi:hypothetical protein